MNDRNILTCHHQFDSRRLDGLARLYSVVDHLRLEIRGCSTGFAFTEYPGTLVDFFVEESRKKQPRHQQITFAAGRNLHHPAMASRCCVTVDFNDGWVRRLGFPLYVSNILWFPEISARLIDSEFRNHIRSLPRVELQR